MAQITTTTQANPVGHPGQMTIDVDSGGGWLWASVRDSSNNLLMYQSTDYGASWILRATLTRANVQEYSGIYVDSNYWLFVAFRTYESGADRIYFRRLSLGSYTWDAEQIMGAAVAGSAGAYHSGIAIRSVFYNSTHYVVVATGTNVGSNRGCTLLAASIYGTTYTLNNGLISGTREWLVTGAGTGRVGPSLDIEHNGNSKTAGTPNLWLAFGRAELNMVKLAWSGGRWTGPTGYTSIVTGVPAQDSIAGRWDGSRWLMAVPYPSDTTKVRVYERNQANSTTTTRTSPTHPTGVVRNCTVAYDSSTKDIRVYAVGTSTAVVYYVDYIRATGLWTAWAVAVATAVLNVTNWGARNSNYGTSRFDVITAHSGAPNTVVQTAQLIPYNPNTPTWDDAGSTVPNGGAANVSAALLLNWNFSDPDPADTQGSYAMSRQIGAGTISYWRASDSTWQATEQQNTSATSSLTLVSGWGAGTDANHTYKVKVWDSTGRASGYSASFVVVPSVVVNPAITSPTAAQVLTTGSVTVTWTATEQTAYRVVLKTNPGGVTTHDSGMVTSIPDRSYAIPLSLADNTGWTVELTTKNVEGLTSAVQSRNFTVDYVEPPAGTLVATASTATGGISVAITNPAPSGGQPAFSSQTLWRRKTADADSGIAIASGLASGATYLDWGAAHGVPYQYRTQVFGVNGTSIYGTWTS